MDSLKINLLFESSPWLLLVCALLGAIYAFVLYQKKSNWPKPINWLLAIVRGILVSLLSLLLLNFFIKKTENKVQKKVIGIVIDNSKSMQNLGKNNLASLKNALVDLKNKLAEKDFEVEVGSFSQNTNIDSLQFNQNATNLGNLIASFKTKHEGRNITDLILLSDGINNQGISPSTTKFPFPINTLAVGDTIAKKDVILKNIIANNIAFKGNDFVVQAEVHSYGFIGKNAQITISQDGKVLQNKLVSFKNNLEPELAEFTISSNKKGLNRYLIQVNHQPGEVNYKNNSREIFIDIVDGQQKILLLAASPHPDIKALKTIIENNENYKLTIGIANQGPKVDFNQKYDLVILHQLPDEPANFANEIKQIKKLTTPIFYIIGNQSAIAALNLSNSDIEIGASSYETDKVNGAFNENFTSINFDKNALKILEKLPPITVPFGDYKTKNEIVVYQKLGNTLTKKPLLLFNNKIPKTAYFMGEGLWAWRMEEYAQTEKNEIVDDLFTKIIQLMAVKDDTRKLRIYPLNKEVDLGQPVMLETEVYNEIFQKTYNNKIKLEVVNEKNIQTKYEYTNLEGNSNFQITGLPTGIYKYLASTNQNGKIETTSGEFIVKESDFEMENLQADFSELRKISKNTGGQFFKINEIGNLEKKILSNNYPDKLISDESIDELISWPWLLALLLLLATIEWAARKYLGEY